MNRDRWSRRGCIAPLTARQGCRAVFQALLQEDAQVGSSCRDSMFAPPALRSICRAAPLTRTASRAAGGIELSMHHSIPIQAGQ